MVLTSRCCVENFYYWELTTDILGFITLITSSTLSAFDTVVGWKGELNIALSVYRRMRGCPILTVVTNRY